MNRYNKVKNTLWWLERIILYRGAALAQVVGTRFDIYRDIGARRQAQSLLILDKTYWRLKVASLRIPYYTNSYSLD